MNEEFIGEVKANIKTLFENQKELKQDIEKLQEDQVDIKELVVVLKEQHRQHQLEYDESKQERSEQNKLLRSMHDNIVNLNSTVKDLQVNISNLSSRVGDLEESSKFNIREFMKEIFYKVLPSVIGGLLLAALIYWLNIK